jgi:hypothetical protein
MAGSEGAIGIGWPRLTFEPAGSGDPGCSGRAQVLPNGAVRLLSQLPDDRQTKGSRA